MKLEGYLEAHYAQNSQWLGHAAFITTVWGGAF
jgi:hypothetical protein